MPRRSIRALTVLPFLVVGLAAAPGAVAADPSDNTAPHLIKACGTGVLTFSDACLTGALADFDAARAKEGLGPMELPSNFTSLTPGQALFVLADIDRVDRGVAPVPGLSSALDALAQGGANTSSDPHFPQGISSGGSNWASTKNALWSEFLWMYDDGPGAGNLDCTAPGDSGCWGHRHNILGSYGAPALMGAAAGSTGDAELFVGGDTRGDSADVMLWTHELPYFAHPPGGGAAAAPARVTWKEPKVHGHRVTLRWQAATGTVTGYVVTAGVKSWDTTRTRLRIRLQPGTYRFRVQARSGAVLGSRSTKLKVKIHR